MPTAAIYARVSTDDQADRQTPIADQIAACERYAASQGWAVAARFSDPGISGAYGPDKRSGLAALLDETGRAWDRLLVWDESRLARDLDLSGHIRYLLKPRGVTIVCATSPDATRLEGGIRRVLADEQRERIRQDVRRAVVAIRQAGGYHGGPHLTGYRWIGRGRDARMEIEPVGAERIRGIYRAALAGESIAAICRLAGSGRMIVHRILRHPGYAGGHRCPDGSVTWNHHPGIISCGDWQSVQARLDRQRGGPRPAQIGRLPLSGRLRCAICGRSLSVIGSHRLRRDGLVWWYGCLDHPQIRRRIREAHLAELLRQIIAHYQSSALHEAIAEELNRAYAEGEKAGAIRAEVRSLTATCRRLEDAIASGSVRDVRGLARRLGDAQDALSQARLRLDTARASKTRQTTPDDVAAAFSRILHAATVPTRETMQRLIDRIEVTEADPAAVYLAGVPTLSKLSPSACRSLQSRNMAMPVYLAA